MLPSLDIRGDRGWRLRAHPIQSQNQRRRLAVSREHAGCVWATVHQRVACAMEPGEASHAQDRLSPCPVSTVKCGK